MTSPARTVADIARTLPFESAVCVADAALRRDGCSRADVDAAVERAGRRRGGPASRRVAAFADWRRASTPPSHAHDRPARNEGFPRAS